MSTDAAYPHEPQTPVADRREIIRQMLIDEGIDPGPILEPVPVEKPPMAEPQDEPPTGEDQDVTATVPFRGRDLVVCSPTVEQVMVIRRMQRLFGEIADRQLSDDQALRFMDRALSAVLSVIKTDDDKAFIEDLLLNGEVTLDDLLPLIHQAVEAIKANQPEGNRADRRSHPRAALITK